MAIRFITAYLQNSVAINPASGLITQMAWVKPYSLPGNFSGIIGFANGANSPTTDKDLVLTSTGTLDYQVYDGATKQATTTEKLVVGQWAHVAAVADGTNIMIYINGVQAASTASGPTYNAYGGPNVFVGASGTRSDSTTRFLDGAMRDAAVWTYPLWPGQIRAIANENVLPTQVMRENLAVYYPLPGYTGVQFGENFGARDNGTPSAALYPETIPRPLLNPPAIIVTPVTDIPVPELNVGVGMFVPGISTPIIAPFLSAGVGIVSPTMTDGEPPPFVPPSLPPSIPAGSPVGPGAPLPPFSAGGLAGIRFYQGPPWRWVITDLNSATITFLDRLTFEAEVTYALDKVWSAKLTIPSDNPEVNILHTDGEPFVSEGNRLLYGFRREGEEPRWVCRFGGKILHVEDSGEAEQARTIVTASNPWQILYQRAMVSEDYQFPDKAGFFSFDDTQTGVIALTWLRNTIINSGDLGIDVGDADFATVDNMPGTAFWGTGYTSRWSYRTKSIYETTTQIDVDCQQGMMVGEVWDQMIETGTLDLILTPIYDPINRPGMLAELGIYERLGDVRDEAVMAWDKPGRNLRSINSIKDGTKRANTIRYYTDQGGPPVGPYLGYSDGASILKYGETWHEEFWPSRIPVVVDALAQLQLELMADGIHTVAVQPTPERMPFLFTEWFLGDTVPVYASDKLRAELAGYQRVYGIVLSIDENSYEQVPQVLASPEA